MPHPSIAAARANRFLRDEAEVRAFEGALAEYAPTAAAGDLPDLYRLFEDGAERHEVMFGLVHLIETLPAAAWVPAYVRALPRLMANAAEWADTILARALNGPETNPLLARELRAAAPDTRRHAEALLDDTAGMSPKPVGVRARQLLDTFGDGARG
jgi:hypothetical protein